MVVEARRPRGPAVVIAVVIAVLFVFLTSARFYTDVLWFQEVDLESVLWKSLRMQFLVGAGIDLGVAAVVYLNLWIAGRIKPAYRIEASPRRRVDPIAQYREMLTPYTKWIRLAISLFIGVITGLGAASSWQTFLLYGNRVSFGIDDPQFGKDVGFYVFELPFLNSVLDFIWFALLASLVFTAAAHYFFGSIRPERGLEGVHPGALAHVSVLLGLLSLVKTGQYWLGQYELNFSPRGVVTGASYTDVNAQLPVLKLLMVISVLAAIAFLVNIRLRQVRLPLATIAVWILIAILAGGVYPLAVQQFSVKPQEGQRERPFIDRNIQATRQAFGLDDVTTQPFSASTDLTDEEVAGSGNLLQNVRVWDPPILQSAYAQLQAIRTYYQFNDVDIDRYEIDGEERQVLLSARELSLEDLPDKSKTWANLHLQYTHGFGLVASLANEQTGAGAPSFLVKDVPGTAAPGAEALAPDQARLYYGENFDADEYSIVNSGQDELDYATEEGVERSNYEGAGGVPVGGIFKRLAFAIREQDPNLLLSGLIKGDSKILIYRNVRDRVRRAAPFLSLDHDPYPAVIEGRVVWILDAYTSTQWYPYSQRTDLSRLVSEEDDGTLDGSKNYVRNSVKVVVDAYDGTMGFYIVDQEDPLIRAWSKAFPDLFTAGEPSDELRAHFRYPEDLFNIQSDVYLSYHMTDPDDFYAKEDEWAIPEGEDGSKVSGTYLLTRLPGESDEEFVLTRPFTPRARNNMIAFMAGRSDPENYGELVTLQFPRSRQVPGPSQVDNQINQDVETSQTLTLLGREGSVVQFGKLVILPIEDSILYIQPLFVTAENVGIPELKKVALVLGERVVLGDDFEDALGQLFDLGTEEPDPTVSPSPGGTPSPSPTEGEDPSETQTLEELVDRAGRVYKQAQRALEDGDFETYGRLIKQLGRLLAQAEQLSQ